MDEQLGGAPSGLPRPPFDPLTWVGYAVAFLLLLYLVWWMPARAPSGYVMPTLEGSVATLPTELPAIWVRGWPWQSTPPDLDVTFLLPGDRKVTVPAQATATPGFYDRAVPATLHLAKAPSIPPTEILGITLEWPGGSSSAVETALWVTARSGDARAPGASTIWSSALSPGARPGVHISLTQHPQVVSVSSPAPGVTPWLPARCLPATQRDARGLLQGRLSAKPQACSQVGGASALVVTPPLPGGYTFFVWQPALQELVNTHLVTLIVGKPLIASSTPMTAGNWWQFAAGGLAPGF